jgi:hypothetical protein
MTLPGKYRVDHIDRLVRLGGLPRSKLPNTIFNTTSGYLKAPANLNIEHLVYQRDDAVESADDYGREYVARLLVVNSPKKSGLLFHYSNTVYPTSRVTTYTRGMYYFMRICKLLEW